MTEVIPIELFLEKWKDHPDIKPLAEMKYDECEGLISELLAEGETWAEVQPFIRGINLHFHGIADLELRKT